MARALGVECKKQRVYLALSDNGTLLEEGPQRLDVPAIHEETDRLGAFLADFGRVLAETRPDAVRILQPEVIYRARYGELAPKAALETLIRLACLNVDIPVEVLQRATARSRLGLGQKGSLDTVIATKISAVGEYWGAGRNYAAVAALAEES